jgi:hypothetical protein
MIEKKLLQENKALADEIEELRQRFNQVERENFDLIKKLEDTAELDQLRQEVVSLIRKCLYSTSLFRNP